MPVSLNLRVKVWLEMVPAILKRLSIQHVDLFLCHSAGTIYLLNTLYSLRDLLQPERPKVVIIGIFSHFPTTAD